MGQKGIPRKPGVEGGGRGGMLVEDGGGGRGRGWGGEKSNFVTT